MAKFLRFTLALCVFALASISLSQVQAAPSESQATLNVEVKVNTATLFWDLTYLTKDSTLAKPSHIQVNWDATTTNNVKTSGSGTVVVKGAESGKIAIRTEKDAQVNYQVVIVGDNNTVLGTISMQTRNSRNQNKVITVAPPESSLPSIVYGDNTTPYNAYSNS
ncbi:MAG: hypothetical protein H6Q74_1993 [Firmicutes bacterium]|nr:hypothetical protein [Bacillota bacterium]